VHLRHDGEVRRVPEWCEAQPRSSPVYVVGLPGGIRQPRARRAGGGGVRSVPRRHGGLRRPILTPHVSREPCADNMSPGLVFSKKLRSAQSRCSNYLFTKISFNVCVYAMLRQQYGWSVAEPHTRCCAMYLHSAFKKGDKNILFLTFIFFLYRLLIIPGIACGS